MEIHGLWRYTDYGDMRIMEIHGLWRYADYGNSTVLLKSNSLSENKHFIIFHKIKV